MSGSESSQFITIRRSELLRFFDEKPEGSLTHATSIVAVVGEDLNAACFVQYLRDIGAVGTILDDSVTTGKTQGPRLDRWIDVRWSDNSRTVFQTEIKSWSAHAIGGKVLSVDASQQVIAEYKQQRWDVHWDEGKHTLKHDYTGKVLVPMNPPKGVDARVIRPLLILWEAIGPSEHSDKHFFSIPNPSNDFPGRKESWPTFPGFPELWVFSVSSYMRSSKADTITLRMPRAAHRIRILQDLFKVGD